MNKWDIYQVVGDIKNARSLCPNNLSINKKGFIKVPPYDCLLRDIFDEFLKMHKICVQKVSRMQYDILSCKHNFREIHSCGSHSELKFSGNRIFWCKKCGSIKTESVISDMVADERIYVTEGV